MLLNNQNGIQWPSAASLSLELMSFKITCPIGMCVWPCHSLDEYGTYRCLAENGPAHSKHVSFPHTFIVMNNTDRGRSKLFFYPVCKSLEMII